MKWRKMPVYRHATRANPLFSDDELRAILATGVSQAEAARQLGVTAAAVAVRIARRRDEFPLRQRAIWVNGSSFFTVEAAE
jgi:hypothetical protein